MAKYEIEESTLTAMADAIRENTGSTAPMTPDDMVQEVRTMSNGGNGSNTGQNLNPVTKTEDMTQPVGVDENGQLWTSHTTSSGSGGGGISVTSINLLIDILKVGMFTANVSGKIDALKEALLAGSSGDSGGSGGSGEDSGGNTGGGETVTDDITVANGIMTIVSVGSAITVSDGIMSIA